MVIMCPTQLLPRCYTGSRDCTRKPTLKAGSPQAEGPIMSATGIFFNRDAYPLYRLLQNCCISSPMYSSFPHPSINAALKSQQTGHLLQEAFLGLKLSTLCPLVSLYFPHQKLLTISACFLSLARWFLEGGTWFWPVFFPSISLGL